MISKYIFLILFSLSLLTSPFIKGQEKALLTVRVKNIKEKKGNLMVAICDKKEQFLSTNTFESLVIPIAQTGSMEFSIELPEGNYSISLFQDLNENNKLDTNLVGIPKEPYGFSNDAKGFMGPPSFEQATISLTSPGKTIEISL